MDIDVAGAATYGSLTSAPSTTAAPTDMTDTGTTPISFNGGSHRLGHVPATAAAIRPPGG